MEFSLVFLLTVLQQSSSTLVTSCVSLEPLDIRLDKEGSVTYSHRESLMSIQPCYNTPLLTYNVTGTCSFCNSSRVFACMGSTGSQFPILSELPPVIEKLQISASDIRFIPREAFFNRSIREIYIENNKLRLLDQNTFIGVSGLQVLSLTGINPPYITTRTFNPLDELRILQLDDNSLQIASTGDFVNFKMSKEEVDRISQRTAEGGKKFVLPSLKALCLRNNPLSDLPKNAFTWLEGSPLTYLTLQSSEVETVHPDALLPLNSTLLDLELRDVSNIGEVLANLTTGLTRGRLERLGLSSTGLARIPWEAIANVAHSLNVLAIQGNFFHIIQGGSFPPMPYLTSLDLRRCSIMMLYDGAFNNLPNLRILLLSGNRFKEIHKPFSQLLSLHYLDLSGNPDPAFVGNEETYKLNFNTFIGLQNLSILSLSGSRIQNLQPEMFAPMENMVKLSLCNTRVVEASSYSLYGLKKLKTLDLSGNTRLKARFQADIFFGLDSLDELYLSNCGLEQFPGDLNVFSYINNLTILDLSNNLIRQIYPDTFSVLPLLKQLNLNSNRLGSWNTPIFFNNSKLSRLYLRDNQLGFITEEMLTEFRNFKAISLQDNPFYCDCLISTFIRDIALAPNVSLESWVEEPNAYTCYESATKILLPLSSHTSEDFPCTHNIAVPPINAQQTSQLSILQICLIVVAILIVFIVPLVILYKKRYNLRYLALSIKNAMTLALLDDTEFNSEGKIYNYDVFVSYCSADRDWVIDLLLPQLESEARLRLCLHERDFQPGYGILENIIHCMDHSKVLLIIVSLHSLKSQWCQFEMHLAQHRLLETRRDKLILVIMSDIPSTQRPRTLHYLMATKTYLIWDSKKSDLFWKRLKRVLLIDKNNMESSSQA